VLFKDVTSDGVHAALADLGVDAGLARRLQARILKHGDPALPSRLHNVRASLLAAVAARARVPSLEVLETEISHADGFSRTLHRGDGPELFESVRIPLLHRPGREKYVVCVSSQAGCAMGCAFCATGRLGWRRDLATWEMVDQVLAARRVLAHPVRGVVFMGMGEPLLNLDRVLRAIAVLQEPCGPAISGKSITISTCGVVPGILELAREPVDARLMVSLVAADEDKRRALMPAARTWPLSDLVQARRAYHAATRRRVGIAWVMMAGVNVAEEDAIALGRLLAGLPIQLSLIPVHDPTGRFQPPSPADLDAFLPAIRRHVAQPVGIRYSGGADIGASCGGLVGRHRGAVPG
jgi:23S rRNA (adenine2503-C2)-methyltransferase